MFLSKVRADLLRLRIQNEALQGLIDLTRRRIGMARLDLGSDPYSRGYRDCLDYIQKGLDPEARRPSRQYRLTHRVDGVGNMEPERDQ